MDRRDFLQGMAATAAGLEVLARSVDASTQTRASVSRKPGRRLMEDAVSVEGYTLITEFKIGTIRGRFMRTLGPARDRWSSFRRPAKCGCSPKAPKPPCRKEIRTWGLL